MKGHKPRISVGRVSDLVLENLLTLPSRWQIGSVNALVHQYEVSSLLVKGYAQVPLVLFEDEPQGLCSQALLAYTGKASLWVSAISCNVAIFGAVDSVAVGNHIYATFELYFFYLLCFLV